MPTIPGKLLTTISDEELSALVAEHCAGWSDIKKTAYPQWFGVPNGKTFKQVAHAMPNIPSFATDANAVLALLGKCNRWKAEQVQPDGVWVTVDAPEFGVGFAETFARAVCFALLKAKGWIVE